MEFEPSSSWAKTLIKRFMPSPEGEGGPPLVVDEVLQWSLNLRLVRLKTLIKTKCFFTIPQFVLI